METWQGDWETRRLGDKERKEVLKLGRWEVWIKIEDRKLGR